MNDEDPEPTSDAPDDPQGLVPCAMTRIVLSEDSDRQFIYVSELEGQRSFPIVIGSPEAREIARVVRGDKQRRPLTHELLHKSLLAVGARLTSVDIVRLERETFFARMRVETSAGEQREIDARPSDAIAVALRARCPLRVARHVLDAAATDN
ncbi:MAG: bifunctional nuclease family protein [Planctomycetota bacterium]